MKQRMRHGETECDVTCLKNKKINAVVCLTNKA